MHSHSIKQTINLNVGCLKFSCTAKKPIAKILAILFTIFALAIQTLCLSVVIYLFWNNLILPTANVEPLTWFHTSLIAYASILSI